MVWWQVLVAPVAAILAVFLTQRYTTKREREQWQSDHQLRWDETRHSAYAAFASAIKHELRLHVMFAEHRWPGTWLHHSTLDYAQNDKALTDAESTRANAFEAMTLLADPETVKAARRWQSAVWALRQASHPGYPDGGAGFMTLVEATGAARNEFFDAARADLGVAGQLEHVAPTPHGGALAAPATTTA